MEKHMSPTRSEITDVANAVIDGCDALVLTDETATGSYPIKCIQTICALIREAEYCMFFDHYFNEILYFHNPPLSENHAIAIAAVEACRDMSAKLIITLTEENEVLSYIAKFRPKACILLLTRSNKLARYMNFFRSCRPMLLPKYLEYSGKHVRSNNLDDTVAKIVNFAVGVALHNSYLKAFEPIVFVASVSEVNKSSHVIHLIRDWEEMKSTDLGDVRYPESLEPI